MAYKSSTFIGQGSWWRHDGVRRLVAWLLLAVSVAGCGPRLPLSISLSGAVSLAEKPVESGLLIFEPLDLPGASPVGAEVAGGKYAAPILPVGKYRVILRPPSPVMTSTADMQPPQPETPLDRLPQTTVDVDATSTTMDITLTPPAGPAGQ
jgi:hypothetical protein